MLRPSCTRIALVGVLCVRVQLGEGLREGPAPGHAVPHASPDVRASDADGRDAVEERQQDDEPKVAPDPVGQPQGRQDGGIDDRVGVVPEAGDDAPEDDDEEASDDDDREHHRERHVSFRVLRLLGQRCGCLPPGQALDGQHDRQEEPAARRDHRRIEDVKRDAGRTGRRDQEPEDRQPHDDDHLQPAGDHHEPGRGLDPLPLQEGGQEREDEHRDPPQPGNLDAPVRRSARRPR